MTRLSHGRVASSWSLADLPALARISLYCFIVMLLGTPSCLVTSTTEFPNAVPSKPFLDANTALATPEGGAGVPVTKLLRVDDDTEVVFLSAQVQAEDAGRPLYARAFINYLVDPGGGDYTDVGFGDTLQPSVFEEVREIRASFLPQRLDDGCYQVSLVVTHQFGRNVIPERSDDTAILVWWMVRGDPSSFTLAQCPTMPPLPELDAGAEAGDQ